MSERKWPLEQSLKSAPLSGPALGYGNADSIVAARIADQTYFVTFAVYMKPDIAEVARVLQVLVRQPIQISHFNAQLATCNVRNVHGLESISEPVMCLTVRGAVRLDRDVERTTKALNRLVSVFKVVAASR